MVPPTGHGEDRVHLVDWTFLGNPGSAWLLALLVGAAFLLVLEFVRMVLARQLGARAAARAEDSADVAARPLPLGLVQSTRFFFILLLSVYAAIRLLTIPDDLLQFIRYVVTGAVALQLGLWGNVIIGYAVDRSVRKRVDEDASSATTISVLGYAGRVVLWSAIVLMALANLGHEITPLLAGMGVGGIAVALAAQNILVDLFASLAIALDKPFAIGDFVIVGDMLGTIEHIGLKTTRIRSLSGEQLVFSNSDLLNSRIRNFKRMYERRVVFGFGVIYQTPYEKLAAIPGMVREIIEAQDQARFDRSHFARYGESSLEFETVYHVLVPDFNVYMDVQQAINLEIFRRFRADGIEFAYPTRTLYVQPPEPAAAGLASAGTGS